MSSATALLVEKEVSRLKLRTDVDLWRANSAHQERGWLLLRHDENSLVVELAFLSQITLSTGSAPISVVACAVRLSYENYDLWPPSLTFIDIVTREPVKPHVRAFHWVENGPRDVLIDAHPATEMPFLCIPGIREYHIHPQHTGDSWLLHRQQGEGRLSTVCERIWRLMSRNVVGLNVQIQALPVWPLKAQLKISLAQGDVQPTPHSAGESADRPRGEQALPVMGQE